MTDPKLEPLDPELDRLFQSERCNPEPPLEVKRRIREGVVTLASLPPREPSVPDPAPDAGAAIGSGLANGVAKVVLIFGLGAASGAGVHAYLATPPVESKPPAPAIERAAKVEDDPVVVEEAKPSEPSAPVPRDPPRVEKKIRKEKITVEPARDTDLAAERSLLQRARMALARGDAGATLLALDEHLERYPDGALAEEREALAINALLRSGKLDEARERAERFRTRYPRSLLKGAIDAALREASP